MSIRSLVSRNWINIPGWHTKRKIVVIESDDWGSIRMPSKDIYKQFLQKGIRVDNDPYCKYDSLATPEDLEALFEVLSSFKDKNGNNPIITANTVVANPDFEKIIASDFNEYFYEPFTETLKRSTEHQGSFNLWQQGIESGVFHPQFHGREHLNVKKWLKVLRDNDPIMRPAFELETFGLTPKVDIRIDGTYMGAFDSGMKEDIEFYNSTIEDGLKLFTKIFNYSSKTFIATRYTWSPQIEPTLYKNGVKYLQGLVVQKVPLEKEKFKLKKNNYQGTRTSSGMLYLMRNCFFEPTLKPDFNWVNDCLSRIKIAFLWNKPATIGMHRLNVIGALDYNNREKNLKLLKLLLSEIIKQYPDVEFLSSDKLGEIISNN